MQLLLDYFLMIFSLISLFMFAYIAIEIRW